MGEHHKQIQIIPLREPDNCAGQAECDHQAQTAADAGWTGQDLIIVQQMQQTLSDISRLQKQASELPDSPAKAEMMAFYGQQYHQTLQRLQQMEKELRQATEG